jgi:hypothetical protein
LVVRDENGEIYTVRYEAVNAMLLNEFLKEAQSRSGRAPQGGKIGSDRRGPRGNGERAGIANPEGERPARTEQTGTANRRE